MKTLKVTVSFKNTAEEIELYAWLIKKSSYSGYLKDLIKKEMDNEIKNNGR
ncbi:MAG: hypothetical protein ACRC7S_14750 [Cetobacterium sp.]